MDISWATTLVNYNDFVEDEYAELRYLIENDYNISQCDSQNYLCNMESLDSFPVQEEDGQWRFKSILQWTHNDVSEWIRSFAAENRFDLSQFCFENFDHIVDGTYLYSMTLDMFRQCDKQYGPYLYESIHNSNIFEILPRFEYLKSPTTEMDSDSSKTFEENSIKNELSSEENFTYRPNTVEQFDFSPHLPAVLPVSSSDDDDDSLSGSDITVPVNTVRRGRGRPRGKSNNMKKKVTSNSVGCLWEFVRNLLHDPNYCPTVIRWENYEEGLFRFVKPDIIANLWGSRKENRRMDYAKFSRALRYYYKFDIFQSVGNRRLVYKFGPTAQGWQTNNPNFEK